jgi:hypothetical protein
MKLDSQCLNCAHVMRPIRDRILRCEAFPEGVPDIIFRNEHDHRKPYRGDHGVRWEPATEEDADFWDRPEPVRDED